MSLAIDIGGHFCRASYMAADQQPRLVDLSASAADAAIGADRPLVRPLPTMALRNGENVHLGESAVYSWTSAATDLHAGAALSFLLGLNNSEIGFDGFVHYVARRAVNAVRRQFQTSVSDIWVASGSYSAADLQRLSRAGKLAGIEVRTAPNEAAAAAHLDLVSSRRVALLNWTATTFEAAILGAEGRPAPARFETLSGNALTQYVLNQLRETPAPNAMARASRARALRRLLIEVSTSPVSLLCYEDLVTLIGERADVVPIAGIRRMLRTEIQRRFAEIREELRAWFAVQGEHTECMLIGGMAKNAALVAELGNLLNAMGTTLTVPRNPENVIVNGLALLSTCSATEKPVNRFLPCNVAIMREKLGAISPLSILKHGANLPAEWSTTTDISGRNSLKLAVATDEGTGSFAVVGELALSAQELAAVPGGKLTISVRAHEDLWLEISAQAGGHVSGRDWLPLSWADGAPHAPAAIAHHVID